jgi:hypothetical protein
MENGKKCLGLGTATLQNQVEMIDESMHKSQKQGFYVQWEIRCT